MVSSERPPEWPAHAVDGVLVLALDVLLSVPRQLRRVEHDALDDGRLEAAGCCWRNTVLGDDATEPGFGLAGLGDATPAVLDERERGVEPYAQPAGGLGCEADGLVPHPDDAVTTAMGPLPREEDRLGL